MRWWSSGMTAAFHTNFAEVSRLPGFESQPAHLYLQELKLYKKELLNLFLRNFLPNNPFYCSLLPSSCFS